MWLFLGILAAAAAIIILLLGFRRTDRLRKRYFIISGCLFAVSVILILIYTFIIVPLHGIRMELDNNPPEEVALAQESIEVTGKVDHASSLIVNGEKVTIKDNGEFSANIPVEKGKNTIVFTASNYVTDKEYSYTVKRKNPDIPLTLKYDKNIEVLTYTIKGTTEPDAKVTLIQDGAKLDEATADQDGHFSFTVDTTDEGNYQYDIVSAKENFTTITKNVSIKRTLTNIPLELSYDEEITVPSYQLKGVTDAGAMVTITDKDGKEIDKVKTGKDGSFSFKLNTFKEGTYTYTISSSLRGYNTSTEEITLDRTWKAVKLDVDYESSIQTKTTTIKGTTQAGASVTIHKGDSKVGATKAGKDGKFSMKVDTAEEGTYDFTVEAKLKGYNAHSEDISIERTMSAAEKRASAKTISFAQLEKNPDKYDGEYVKYTGEILQISEGYFMTGIRLAVTQTSYGWYSADDVIWVEYVGTTDFVEEDVVTVYGEITGTYSYTSIAGWEITIPAMEADTIE